MASMSTAPDDEKNPERLAATASSTDPTAAAAAAAHDSAQHQAPVAPLVADPDISTARTTYRVHYGPELEDQLAAAAARTVSASRGGGGGLSKSDIEPSGTHNATSPLPSLRRRNTRSNTFRSVEDFSEFELQGEGWHPGAEPGVDPYKTDGGRASLPKLSANCEITCVDFSQADIDVRNFTNNDLEPFLKEPQPGWAKCRWINVNGLSWDVISALGKYKKLHKLSIEDIMNTRNRTKTDWYANHAFVIFTMLKLAHVTEDASDDDLDYLSDGRSMGRMSNGSRSSTRKPSFFVKGLSKAFRAMSARTRSSKRSFSSDANMENGEDNFRRHLPPYNNPDLSTASGETLERTLQRYHAGPNEARIEFMEKHSALLSRRLTVIAEQVSIFITNDNTIISFFELSADLVEKPILTRLYTPDTVLRQSCDASMVGQAIIDAVIDLAIPVASVYADTIGDLELDVLTHPDVTHTKQLYIIIYEINKILSVIHPVVNLINTLRDHKTEMSQESATLHLQDTSKGVIITPMTHTYLGDVLDHCVLIIEALNSIKSQADGLISLIFNTISAYQNESMKQLSRATLFFLPLTFLTGYFGQNLEPFDDLKRGVSFFWSIAAPMSFVTILVLTRDMIFEWFKTHWQRRSILQARKKRRQQQQDRKRRSMECGR